MHFVVLILLFLAVFLGPQLWVRSTLRRYSGARDDFPGTGGEFARHLLDKFNLHHVKVEATERGDHYDPVAKVVRLAEGRKDARSLTAVVVAAHEVGHAIQDGLDYPPLRWRSRLVAVANTLEKVGALLMLGLPVMAAITRSPAASAAMFVCGAAVMLSAAVVHLVTLPVEWDASFGRAMPLLKAGRYLDAADEKKASNILRVCALTYLAASLASLLNFWRWLRLWRR